MKQKASEYVNNEACEWNIGKYIKTVKKKKSKSISKQVSKVKKKSKYVRNRESTWYVCMYLITNPQFWGFGHAGSARSEY